VSPPAESKSRRNRGVGRTRTLATIAVEFLEAHRAHRFYSFTNVDGDLVTFSNAKDNNVDLENAAQVVGRQLQRETSEKERYANLQGDSLSSGSSLVKLSEVSTPFDSRIPSSSRAGSQRLMKPTMTAIVIREPGGPDVLVPEERPVPQPGPEEILVAVAAAGVNRPDVMQRAGKYPPPPGASDIPGLEISGMVAAVGSAVTRWREGDRVVALVSGGGYAEYCLAHESVALPFPETLSLVEGAALTETIFTVWHNVFQRGALKVGEWLLVHGGTSGIGTTAIQLAKAFGARVATTAGSEEKCNFTRRLGADLAINYKTEDFVAAMRDGSDGHGADVILDMVGGDYLARNMAAAADDARLVQISALAGAQTKLDLWQLLSHRLTLTGSTLRSRPVAFKAALARAIEISVWPLIAQGRFRPVIDQVIPFVQAAQAHQRIDSGDHIGKLVLTVYDPSAQGSGAG
jgi:putative PIG3 family NAD(P)H quinone oxidoreductase